MHADAMTELAATRILLSRLVNSGRIDEETAKKHLADAEFQASHGIILDLRIA
jgi:hypothetical protein